MPKKEKFGKFVLLDEIGASGLGAEYRAAKLNNAGLEKIVAVLRLSPSLSANPEVAKQLMEQAKVAAQLQNPNISKIFGIGKVDHSYYISCEFVEGKSLRVILNRCRKDNFPFSVDHALLIASKISSALEYAHNRKSQAGRYFHGLLNPGHVLVSYEGEVRVRGFGYWPSGVRDAGALREEEATYLAPEQAAGGVGDHRSDIFSTGAILFEGLTGQPLDRGGSVDPVARLDQARLQSPAADDDSLPRPIADILSKALAVAPPERYGEIAEMRKAIDTLLFSGDFTPTTFNLAFFMHSLFRDDIDSESKALKEDRETSYGEFLTDEAVRKATASVTLSTPIPVMTPVPGPVRSGTIPVSTPVPRYTPVSAPTPIPGQAPPAHTPVPQHSRAPAPAPEPPVSAREAAAGFTFHKDEPRRSSTPALAGGAVLLLLVGGGLGWYFLGPSALPAPTPPPVTTLSPEAQAALDRVRELEEKLTAFEAERAAAAVKASDEARKKLEAQAKALGTVADPAAIARAQEDAARKARQEEERKQLEERRRLEEAKAAEEARLVEVRRKAEEEAAVAATAATTTLPPTTALPPATQAAVKPGALVDLSEPGVTPPVPERTPPLYYPPVALRQRIEGTVELNVLVDDRGVVTDAQIVTSAGGRAGLDEAAVDNAKKRRYRPATKDGVPVKVWMPLRVQFRLPS